MRALFHIEQELNAINEELINSGGELSPELETTLAITQEELSNKSANYAIVILKNEADVNILEAEIKRLQALKVPIEATNEKLKEAISNAMLNYGIEKVETPLVKLSFRKSESVQVFDEAMLNQKFFNYAPTIDKTAIKQAIKAGEDVQGARIETKHNLQVK